MIIFGFENDHPGDYTTAHLGYGKVSLVIPSDSLNDLFVQADGDELEKIKNLFSNLPMCGRNRVVIWRGELARFILENLTL